MEFLKYLKAVGTGPKSNRDLTYEEAFDMMTQILDQKPYPEQIAAFLVGWRLKPETVEEFRGALAACDAMVRQTHVPNSIELGYPYDGKRRNPYIFPLVAKFLQKEGINLVISGDELQPAKNGITTKQIAENISLASNIRFFDRKEYFPQLSALTQIRQRVGLRTAFNTTEKLSNVAKSEAAITGVFHKPYVKKYVEIFADRYDNFALIQGNEGTPELFSKGRLWIATNGNVTEHILDPHAYGIDYTKSWENITLEESLGQIENPSSAFRELARFNAAVYLLVMGRVASIEEGMQRL